MTIQKRLDGLVRALQPKDKIIVRLCWCGGEPGHHKPGCPAAELTGKNCIVVRSVYARPGAAP